MPENEKPVNIHWLVRVAGCDEELLVYAAYVQYHDASVPTKTTLRTASDDVVLTTFKNADHKVVFQALAAAVVYVRRADVTAKVDRDAPPGQIRDLKDGIVAAAGESTPAQTLNIKIPTSVAAGAAGAPQTFNVAFPAPGQGIA